MYLSYDPFYFDPEEDVEVSDRTCWWVASSGLPPTARFALCTGDRESWETLEFQCDGPQDDAGWDCAGPGQPFHRPARSHPYPWLGWVTHLSGGLDV